MWLQSETQECGALRHQNRVVVAEIYRGVYFQAPEWTEREIDDREEQPLHSWAQPPARGHRECGTVGHPHPCSHCGLGTPSTGPAKVFDPCSCLLLSRTGSGSRDEDRVRWSCQALCGPAVAIAAILGYPCLALEVQNCCVGVRGGTWQPLCPPAPFSGVQGVTRFGSAWFGAAHTVLPGLGPCSPWQAVGVWGAEAHTGGGPWGQPGLCSLLHPSGLCLMIPRW